MKLADLGRWIAGQTADTRAAGIARSSAPQLRYDAVVSDILRNPQHREAFTPEQRSALAGRIANSQRRNAAIRDDALTAEQAQQDWYESRIDEM